jgi:hypothetical protein
MSFLKKINEVTAGKYPTSIFQRVDRLTRSIDDLIGEVLHMVRRYQSSVENPDVGEIEHTGRMLESEFSLLKIALKDVKTVVGKDFVLKGFDTRS